METIERIPQIPTVFERSWLHYLLDTAFAVVGTLLLTGIMYTAHLYPTIPDVAILYLLVILPLALWRGSYAAIVAAVVASLSFDFFLVPPLYTLNVGRWEEWLGLLIFLLTALLISLLAALVRRSAEAARLREREARILYELMRVTNDANLLNEQLDAIVLAVVRVFASWGLHACALLLPAADGTLAVSADAPIRIDGFTLSAEELQAANMAMTGGEIVERHDVTGSDKLLRLLPLKARNQVLGVLCLRIQNEAVWHAHLARLQAVQGEVDSSFFQTFIDQTTSLVERALLRAQLVTHHE